jgi:predicted hotdog family 3-hydroxylacyl-ACP dehydratase
VRNDGLLGNDKTVPAWVGIEYMAQAIAAYAGVMSKRAGDPVKLGFLLGTKRYNSNVAEFRAGSTLTVHVEKTIQDDNLGAFECNIQGCGVEVTANLNVYQPPLKKL